MSILLLPLLGACGRDVPASSQVGVTSIAPADREPLPAVAGATLDGGTLDIADFTGKVVVLNAWASWCGPCKEEVPAFVALHDAADPADVAVVGLDVSDDAAAAASFVAQYGMTYPSIVDTAGEILARLPGVPPAALPSTLVVDREGRVAARIIGVADSGELGRIVADVSAEPASS